MANRHTVDTLVDRLCTVFRRKRTEGVVYEYYRTLKSFDDQVVNAAADLLIERETTWPYPAAVKRFCREIAGPEADQLKPGDYDPNEDNRYPLVKMWYALKLLDQPQGRTRFDAYCRATGMPRLDRERVLAKYQHAYTGKEVERYVQKRQAQPGNRFGGGQDKRVPGAQRPAPEGLLDL